MLLACVALATVSSVCAQSSVNARPGELLIKFKAHTSAAQRQAVLARRGAKVIRHFSALDIDHVRVAQSRGARADTKAFAADDAIVYAQP
ncbi:MAG: S8 family serine peptidase, partial [Chthoniobacterales bacterium]